MKNHTDYKINLDYKCPLKFDKNIKFSEGQRFCGTCQRNVFNFCEMSDEEIFEIASKQDGYICGRIQTDRLSNPPKSTYKEKSLNSYSRSLFITTLFASFFNAQISHKKDTLNDRPIIDGVIIIAKKSEDGDYERNYVKYKTFTGNLKEAHNKQIFLLTPYRYFKKTVSPYGDFEFKIPEDHIHQNNLLLVQDSDSKFYHFIVTHKQFNENDRKTFSFSENNYTPNKSIEKGTYEEQYIIDGEDVEFEEFVEKSKTDKDFIYFYLDNKIATALLDEKFRTGVFVGYSKNDY